jgi:Pyridoxamine 5'-phosphate oxidase
MGRIYDEIDRHLAGWIACQPLFFVGSAPLSPDGHVNVSPKGPIGTLRVLDSRTVAYLDLLGSGAETAAHVRENGRIVVMLCAFEGPPRIVRLHGRGRIVRAGEAGWDELIARCEFTEPDVPETRRAVIVVDVTRIADSCGYGVPLMTLEGPRPHMGAWAQKKLRVGGVQALADYREQKNGASIDGLPAYDSGG